MADKPLTVQLHAIGVAAAAEAVRRGARSVEAEHVLLAIAAGGSPVASDLSRSGLDHNTLDAALSAERTRSLAVAGVKPVVAYLTSSTTRASRPDWGTSVRELIRTAEKPTTRVNGALEAELVVGILRARLGTVPRALAFARIDTADLVAGLTATRD